MGSQYSDKIISEFGLRNDFGNHRFSYGGYLGGDNYLNGKKSCKISLRNSSTMLYGIRICLTNLVG